MSYFFPFREFHSEAWLIHFVAKAVLILLSLLSSGTTH